MVPTLQLEESSEAETGTAKTKSSCGALNHYTSFMFLVQPNSKNYKRVLWTCSGTMERHNFEKEETKSYSCGDYCDILQ